MLLEVVPIFARMRATRNAALATVNLGLFAMRTGVWSSAQKYFERARQMVAGDYPEENQDEAGRLGDIYVDVNVNHLEDLAAEVPFG